LGRHKISKFEYFLVKEIGRAIAEYNMIEDGDNVLVAVSGGKDSLSLLKILHDRRRWVPINYDLLAVHIQTDHRCAGCVHTDVLSKLFSENNYKYHIEKISLFENNKDKEKGVSCFWCSWNRRKALFRIADKFGCNKIAFGHHMDDIAETLLLNIFYNGEVSTMPPYLEIFGGTLKIIRPLLYVDESKLARFARECGFPENLCKCPNGLISRRKRIKNLIQDLSKENPQIKINILNSLRRVKEGYLV